MFEYVSIRQNSALSRKIRAFFTNADQVYQF